jgi:hypothetical protein
MSEWAALSSSYSGWTLKDIRKLSRRERTNWLEIAREQGKVTRDG